MASPAAAPEAAFADDLASALEASDYARLLGMISAAGFVFALYQSEPGKPLTPDETIEARLIRRPTARPSAAASTAAADVR